MTTLTFGDIIDMDAINDVEEEKVVTLAKSIKLNGWNGTPILVHCGINQLVTGSHRFAALSILAEDDPSIYDLVVAVDVSEIVDAALMQSEGYPAYSMIDYSDLGWIFEGTEIEQYKSEIEEW